MSNKRVSKTSSPRKSGKKTTQTISKKTQTRSDMLNEIIKLTKKYAKGKHNKHLTHVATHGEWFDPVEEQRKETFYSPWFLFMIDGKREYVRVRLSYTFGNEMLFSFVVQGDEKERKFKSFNKEELSKIISLIKKRSIDDRWSH